MHRFYNKLEIMHRFYDRFEIVVLEGESGYLENVVPVDWRRCEQIVRDSLLVLSDMSR